MNFFTNEVINIDDLPKYEMVKMVPLRQDYLKVMQLNFLFMFLFFGAVVCFAAFLIPDLASGAWFIITGYILLMILVFFLQRIAFRNRSYAVRERDILYRSGILSTRTMIIPFNRIQHVGVNEGWISRLYRLAQVQIFTAGGSSGDIRIPGINITEAENIREMIMQKITGTIHSNDFNEMT